MLVSMLMTMQSYKQDARRNRNFQLDHDKVRSMREEGMSTDEIVRSVARSMSMETSKCHEEIKQAIHRMM